MDSIGFRNFNVLIVPSISDTFRVRNAYNVELQPTIYFNIYVSCDDS